jgi:hypothetical protein
MSKYCKIIISNVQNQKPQEDISKTTVSKLSLKLKYMEDIYLEKEKKKKKRELATDRM